jgi:hypothetical protein
MKTVTLLGVMLAFALGTTGCSRSSDTSRHDTTGGERARSDDARERAEQEDEEYEGKAESWGEEVDEAGEDARRELDEAGDRTEEQLEDAEEYIEDRSND